MTDNNNRPLHMTEYYMEMMKGRTEATCGCAFEDDYYCSLCESLRLADETELDQRMALVMGKMPETLSKPEVDFIKWMKMPSL